MIISCFCFLNFLSKAWWFNSNTIYNGSLILSKQAQINRDKHNRKLKPKTHVIESRLKQWKRVPKISSADDVPMPEPPRQDLHKASIQSRKNDVMPATLYKSHWHTVIPFLSDPYQQAFKTPYNHKRNRKRIPCNCHFFLTQGWSLTLAFLPWKFIKKISPDSSSIVHFKVFLKRMKKLVANSRFLLKCRKKN